jgi:hypothetical protein
MKKIPLICFILFLAGTGCVKSELKDSDLRGYTWVLNYIQNNLTEGFTKN